MHIECEYFALDDLWLCFLKEQMALYYTEIFKLATQ